MQFPRNWKFNFQCELAEGGELPYAGDEGLQGLSPVWCQVSAEARLGHQVKLLQGVSNGCSRAFTQEKAKVLAGLEKVFGISPIKSRAIIATNCDAPGSAPVKQLLAGISICNFPALSGQLKIWFFIIN